MNTTVLRSLYVFAVLFITIWSCKPTASTTMLLKSSDITTLKHHDWETIDIPFFNWQEGTSFGSNNELHVDARHDNKGITIKDDEIHFHVNPTFPHQGKHKGGKYNFRSEIRTVPWPIKHPIGTEQWIGWRYRFSEDYVIDETSPITIFQNHNGTVGMSPAIELEIAAKDRPHTAKGGEIQIVNATNRDRVILDVCPKAGTVIDIVLQVIYGDTSNGVLKLWINGEIKYFKNTSTVYEGYPWGGNNKWGIYHHTFWDNDEEVQSSLDIGAGVVDLYMGSLKVLTRTPSHPEYKINAYDLVVPE